MHRFSRAAVLVVLTLSVMLLPLGVTAANDPAQSADSVVSVTGSSVVKVHPDRASVSLGVDTAGVSARAAQEANSVLMNSILKALKTLGFEKEAVKTDRFSVNPDYSYDSKTGRSKLIGYRAQNRVVVTTSELAKVGSIIDSSIQAGATTVESISYSLKDSDKAKLEALKLAAKDARSRAEVMASALGLKLSGIRAATDSDIGYAPVVQSFKASADARSLSMSSPTPIQEGDIELTAQVMVEFLAR